MNDIRFVVSPRIMGEEKFFGPGIAVLLHRVEEYHSIRQATASMGMAYSKAWAIIRRAERELGFPLLNTTTGGKEGGGASLPAEGQAFPENGQEITVTGELEMYEVYEGIQVLRLKDAVVGAQP